MNDFEKMGVFYLGKEYDLDKGAPAEGLTLYPSKDLTTHGVIIGMTGSGKTGLGIGLIEEAAIDNIPVLAIDPKGDLGNLALTFPSLDEASFLPWINLEEARNKNMSPQEYAGAQAELWRKGLGDWGQDGGRIQRFRDASQVTVYTPGGSAGPGISLLKSFDAPDSALRSDGEMYRDRISVTAEGLLSLVGLTGDVFNSREHILLSALLEQAWNRGASLGLAELIQGIQSPPMDKVGVMDLENFFPSKDRFQLAVKLNNLLASPHFKDWLEGEPLDIGKLCYDQNGKPRVSVFSIAHLSEQERMFFVTLFLNEVISWMRSQPGTGSLRALLYMDELYGYLPPTANPPSKGPLLTLLKQARAYGLGLVLSTQNPVDLDYKALSNAGSWFIGRLQTERDKQRVLEGLEGAALGGGFHRGRTEQILAGLGKRVFYLHSVHGNEPEVFTTRWTLSYLAGPMTRDQIMALPGNRTVPNGGERHPAVQETPPPAGVGMPQQEQTSAASVGGYENHTGASGAPVLNPKIKQVFFPVDTDSPVYDAYVLGAAEIHYTSEKYKVSETLDQVFLAPLRSGLVPLDWKEAIDAEISLKELSEAPAPGASYSPYPAPAADASKYEEWARMFVQHIKNHQGLKLLYDPKLKEVSSPGEDERDFRIRLQHLAHELRDEAIEKLKQKYQPKFNTLVERQRRAEQAVERENTQASQRKMEAAVSAGSAILGALLGKKALTATSVSKMGTAVKSTTRMMKSGQEISQAEDTLEAVRSQIGELEMELKEQIDRMALDYDLTGAPLETIEIKPANGEILLRLVALAWKSS